MEVDSPISSLHPELLAEIFQCIVYPERNKFQWYERLTDARTRLSCVCQAWRDVVHSTPALWAVLRLEAFGCHLDSESESLAPPFYRICPGLELVERWLQRSAAYPLDLTLDLKERLGIESEEERVVQLVRGNHSRLRTLRVECTLAAKLGLNILEALVKEGDIPKLEVLAVCAFTGTALEAHPQGLTLKIPYSKRLLELDLDFSGRIIPIFPLKPFDNLRSLTITTSRDTPPSPDTVLDMLGACSNTLVSFSWNAIVFPPATLNQIILPSLTSLRIIAYTSENPAPFLSLLTLPSLSSLHIDLWAGCDLPLAFSPGLLSRSLCPESGNTRLEEIHVQTLPSRDLPIHEVLEILRVSPRLESFFFTVPLTEKLALSLVSEGEGGTTLAPHLHHMEFGRSWQGDYVPLIDAFVKMIISRWGGPAGLFPGKGCLRSVCLRTVRGVERRAMYTHTGLRDCIEEGFHLKC